MANPFDRPQLRSLADLMPRPIQPMASHWTQRDEQAFRQWYDEVSRQYGLNPNPDAPEQFYDYRGAYKAGAVPDGSGHWPSTFKQVGHPNMVVGGFHVQTGERVHGTRQAGEQELIQLGWDPAFAARVSRRR